MPYIYAMYIDHITSYSLLTVPNWPSPASMSPGPALLCCLGEVQGPLSHVMLLLKVGAALPHSWPPGELSCLLQVEGEGRGHLSLTQATTRQKRGRGLMPSLMILGMSGDGRGDGHLSLAHAALCQMSSGAMAPILTPSEHAHQGHWL